MQPLRTNALGVTSQMATNGSLIDEAMAKDLVADGPTRFVLSLNSPRAEVHDKTRGRNGSYEEVINALRFLKAARSKSNRSKTCRLYCTSSASVRMKPLLTRFTVA